MPDPRHRRLARLLVEYSCALQPGDNVLIEAVDVPEAFVRELVAAAAAAGARPLVTLKSQAVWRALMLAASEEQMRLIAEAEATRMRQMDAYIGIRGNPNVSEWSDVPGEKMALYERFFWKPVHQEIRVRQTRWVVLRWPNPSMAQLAQTSSEAFEDFYFDVCTVDYARMSRAMQPLAARMEAADRVRLVAPGTELTFSIRGIPAVPCDGKLNIPDGEVFTAPVRDSVNGTIAFNCPTVYQGVTHENVRLTFRDGRIVAATSSDPAHLARVLDSDEGARYVGEFAIGFHPLIRRPMKDILFDEKIAGSIHFTPGQAYEEADNGNESQIHWDLVLRMDPEVGGGEIWFDDHLLRKDGRFVPDDLQDLNPERLLAGHAAAGGGAAGESVAADEPAVAGDREPAS
ncbi:MAG TPA: aminopeptidase [Thermoanaerobaculia bacterium]|nr:aminopeptidase [Thermoanaerobaculia bacterium]